MPLLCGYYSIDLARSIQLLEPQLTMITYKLHIPKLHDPFHDFVHIKKNQGRRLAAYLQCHGKC